MKLNLYLASIALTPQSTSRITHPTVGIKPASSPLPIMTIITIIIIKYTNHHHLYHHHHHHHHHYHHYHHHHHQSPSRSCFQDLCLHGGICWEGNCRCKPGFTGCSFQSVNFNLFVILVMLSVEIGKSQDFTNLTRLKHLTTLIGSTLAKSRFQHFYADQI